MEHEPKPLDALVVDIEDSTTLLKLYVGRLLKAPGRSAFFGSLVLHGGEIAAAVGKLDPEVQGRTELTRVARLLTGLAAQFAEQKTAAIDRLLVFQESIDLLEAQLDHTLQNGMGPAPEVTSSLARVESAAGIAPEYAPMPLEQVSGPLFPEGEPTLEEMFEEDPFDEFALSEDFLDELVSGFDAALDASMAEPSDEGVRVATSELPPMHPELVQPGPVQLSATEEQELRELFSQIASGYVGPIVDFIAKLRVGPVTIGWIELCSPAVHSMKRASESMGYGNLSATLGRFEAILEQARAGARVVDGDDRIRLLSAYQELAGMLPEAFPLVEPDAQSESESIILNSLLKQIKGVGRVTIGRLFSAGLVTLEAFYVADPDDMAAAAGLRPSLALRICERFRSYRDAAGEGAHRPAVVRRLEELVAELRMTQFQYKQATLEEWYTHSPSRAKAKARRSRQQTMWKINVALAELGELKLINALKDDVYDKRLARLGKYIVTRTTLAADGAGGREG